MTAFEFMRDRLQARAGLNEQPRPRYRLMDLEKSEWCPEFERLMRNRLLMGALRYGLIADPSKPNYGRIDSILRRAGKFKESGNLELLVDIANLALVEFARKDHPKSHFISEDDGEHVKTR